MADPRSVSDQPAIDPTGLVGHSQVYTEQIDLSTYIRVFPWAAAATCIASASAVLLLDPDSAVYSQRMVGYHTISTLIALVACIWGVYLYRRHPVSNAQPQLLLGIALIISLVFCNIVLLFDTNLPHFALGGAIVMLGTAMVYPRLGGVLLACVPQTLAMAWLCMQNHWSETWLIALFTTGGSAGAALLTYYTRHSYFSRYHALLAERADMIEKLKFQSANQVRAQDQALTERNLQSLSRLAGGVAHDLNNILVPILGNAAMLAESSQTSVQQRQSKEVVRAAQRARNLTQQLGYFAARDNSAPEVLELGQTLGELYPIVWRTFPQGVDINLHRPEQPVYLDVSRTKLQDVLTSLLLDAANASAPGDAVVMTITPNTSLPPHLASGQQESGGYCEISISDSGKPLTTIDRSKLFSATPVLSGHERGMGLSGILDNAAALNGFVEVGQTDSGRNLFCLFLPVKKMAEEREDTLTPQVSAGLANEILVVDDERAVRGVTTQLLERAGFVVRSCDSGEAALEEVARHLPDAVVMDLRMPGMGGQAAAEAIREHNSQLPIVICTGYSGDAQGWLAQMTNSALLQKPYDTSDLITMVKKLLNAELVKG